MRNYQVNYDRYTFNAEDDWGYYDNGERKEAKFNPDGYASQWYKCTDEKYHKLTEHIAKWEYFNEKIPEGYEIDHKTPISNGGTNKLSNLRLVTHKENCNNKKTLENLSKSLKESDKTKSWLGKHHTEKTKHKMMMKNPRRKEIVQYSLNGEIVSVWHSASEAARSGFNASSILRCCNGEFKQHKGYKWNYK